MKSRAATAWFALVVLSAASGAQCHRRDAYQPVYGPRVLTQNPSLADVMQAVNDNSAKIRSLYTTDATLTVPDAPTLRANLALERQKRLRLRAETALTGAELDLGSNDDLFWVWVRRQSPTTVYFCRHAQLSASAAKQILPVDPQWLLDAIGLTSFDAAQQHFPPQRNANGRLEIRTLVPGPTGTMTKTTVVDEARAWVLEQHLHDERGTLVASALTGRHWRDPGTGAIVPQEIEIRWPATQFSLKFDVRQWSVNQINADPAQLFSMPSVSGWNVVDLADPNLRMPQSAAQAVPPAGGTAMPWTATSAPPSVMGPFFEPQRAGSAGSAVASPPSSVPVGRRY
jgi:hypothetical protein